MGLAITPLAFAATAGVAPTQAGLASGVLNTSRQVGASVALAALATIAADRTQCVARRAPVTPSRTRLPHEAAALTAGFSRGFSVAALIALGGVVAGVFIPRPARPPGAVVAEPGARRVEGVAAGAETDAAGSSVELTPVGDRRLGGRGRARAEDREDVLHHPPQDRRDPGIGGNTMLGSMCGAFDSRHTNIADPVASTPPPPGAV